MSNTKKSWKERVLHFMQVYAPYFESVSVFVTGSDYIPFHTEK